MANLFMRFEDTSRSLEESYDHLRERVESLTQELECEREQRIHLERKAAMGELAMELAHEIRNPLASIELYASMLEGPHSSQVVQAVRLLNHTVTNVLQFGKGAAPEMQPVEGAALLAGVLELLRPLAEKKGIRLESASTAGRWIGDAELLRRGLINLVLNALRETPGGGHVRMSATGTETGVRLIVEDDGPGIPAEAVGKIFDPMFSTRRDGNGLGLSVLKRIVDGHSGTIRVETSSRGTAFVIDLPQSFDATDKEVGIESATGRR